MSGMFGTGIVINIPSAIILKDKSNPEEAVRISEEEGKLKASFQIGKQMYDSRYKDGVHYNNFIIYAYGDVAERVQRLKLKTGSCVHIWAKMDLTPDILKSQDQSKENGTVQENESPDFAHSRWHRGIRIELIAIDYAGGSKRTVDVKEGTVTPVPAKKAKEETTSEKPGRAPAPLPVPNSTASSDNTEKKTTMIKENQPPQQFTKNADNSKTLNSKPNEDIGVDIVDLDSGIDIFRKPHRFFGK